MARRPTHEVIRMKKIEAIIRPEKLDVVRKALDGKGFPGMTSIQVEGRGRQKGITLQWRAGEYRVEFLSKVKLEVLVDDDEVEQVVDIICDAAATGKMGDGKIFILPVEDVVRVRTRERGLDAIGQANGK
jgi:nitrogen regulatory protein P-II 1